ncbi:hypothetical protein [Mariniplasma anaerobium]|uniref:Uncharacterized protein n=1 Tax=Mariniplasma anaerobium TaxID=2735436 RepID=A0A7U9XWF4_9MOLU|nr:hypothetical protein [Mariniplasma anaerobium]BCR35208.1 hypothetical protein MPAN_001010 [Mariniplasma anaerobium]
MKRRKCSKCGEDISHRPKNHYLCYECWLVEESNIQVSNVSLEIESHANHGTYNQTYEERYKGDSDYDIGPYWDYDEYPPENL